MAKSNIVKIHNLKRSPPKSKKQFPKDFPFWARLKISKNRTTLVIDEELVINKKNNQLVAGYVHREATSQFSREYEEIIPNPDKTKNSPMYLKRPRKHPKILFKQHNRDLTLPKQLIERYSKNNKK